MDIWISLLVVVILCIFIFLGIKIHTEKKYKKLTAKIPPPSKKQAFIAKIENLGFENTGVIYENQDSITLIFENKVFTYLKSDILFDKSGTEC